MEVLVYLVLAVVVLVVIYAAIRVLRRDGKPVSLREFGRAVDDEAHAIGREVDDKAREQIRRGGGSGDDKQ